MYLHLFTTDKSKGILHYLIPVIIFCFWLCVYRYHLQNQELFTLFLYTTDFFTEHISKPGGLTNYAGLFIIQYFRYLWIGAFFHTLTFFLVYFFTSQIAKKIGILGGWTGILYIPSLTLLGLQMQYEFVFCETLKVILYFGLFYGYLFIQAPKIRLIASIAAAPLLLTLLGGGIFIQIYLLFTLYELCFSKQRISYAGIIAWIIIVPVLPLLYKQITLISNTHIYGLFPNLVDLSFRQLIYIPFIWLPLFLLCGWCVKKYYPTLQSPGTKTGVILSLLIICPSLWILKEKCYYPKIEQLFHIDNAVAHENWDEVLQVAKNYSGSRPSAIVLTNLALAQKGRLAEDLFEYRQIGINGLIHPWENNYFSNLYGHEVFYRLGQTNEAFRWIFEAAVCKSTTIPPHVTKRIVEILIKLEKYEAAQKYLYHLLKTHHHREWARKTLRTLPETAAPNLSRQADFIVGSMGTFYDLVSMATNEPENQMLRDYLLTGFLLDKRVTDFYAFFCQYFQPGNIKKLPKVYEEALLAVLQQGIDKNVLEKYNISKNSIQQFRAYLDALQTYGTNNPDTPAKLTPQFGNTFWFYCNFVTQY